MSIEEISTCNLCGSTNYQKFHNTSTHSICYYCYCIKNKYVKDLNSFIENESFEEIIKNLNFENTNSYIINYKEIHDLKWVNYYDSDFKNKNPLNILLKHGRVDNLIIPNIENLNIIDFLNSSRKLLSKDGNIYIGFYTSISYLIKRKLIEHIEYIYNIYLISNLLSKNFADLYINDFFIYGDYILLKINNKKSFKKEGDLQKFFDQLFFANFKKEIKYGI